jgi:Spy/CpxP family protein refolding chaperone
MIRVGATMFALLVAANVAVAQGGGGGGGGNRGGGRGGPQGQRMADGLLANITLDDATKAKVADVVKWYDDEAAKLTPAGRGADSATMAKSRADRTKLTADFRSKLKAALAPAQQKAFDTNAAAADSAAAARGRGRRGGGL